MDEIKLLIKFDKIMSIEKYKKHWSKYGWIYAVVLVYALVVLKSATFETSKASELGRYDGRIFNVSSEDGELEGTVGLSRKGEFLQATYNLYLKEELPQNDVCFSCQENPAFSRPCRSVDKYNYAGMLADKDAQQQKATGLVAPVFCGTFKKPKNPTEGNISWANAVCFSQQTGEDLTTEKFYFSGAILFQNFEEVFQTNEFEVFDAKEFVVRDSCAGGVAGSNFEKTDVEKAIQSGKSAKSFSLKFEE